MVEDLVHDDYKARTPQGSLKRGVAKFAARAEYELADLRAAIDAEEPDVILVDAMSWGASAAAAAWDGPWAQWFPYPLPVPSRDVPPFGPGLTPASGPLGRLRDRALRPLMLSSMEKVFLPFGQRRPRLSRPAAVLRRLLRCSPPLRCCSI